MSIEEKIQLFEDTFKGRNDAYGSGTGLCVKAPITTQVIMDHLTGKKRIGRYPLSPDIMDGQGTYWIAADIDTDDIGLVIQFCEFLEHILIPCYIERSKSKGYHIWVFFSEPVSAKQARGLMQYAIELLERDTDYQIKELFPKQTSIKTTDSSFIDSSYGYGNYINLPLFGADVPNGRTSFLNPDDGYKPFQNQWDFLKTIEKISPAKLREVMENNFIATNEGNNILEVMSCALDSSTKIVRFKSEEMSTTHKQMPAKEPGKTARPPSDTPSEVMATSADATGGYSPQITNGLSPTITTTRSPSNELSNWKECEFLQYCQENAKSLPEPLWYAMLSTLSRFEAEGRRLAHQLSQPYPNYSESETNKKLDHAFTASGPMTCNEIATRGFRCPSLRRCKANAPASLIGQLSGITILSPEIEDYELITTPKTKTIIPLSLSKVVPPDSYLSLYMEYASAFTDAPDQFHVFSGLSALSTVIGTRVYLPWGDGRLYPNLWIAVIAPSSIYRKTTAIRIACNLSKHVDETRILPDEFSPESLLNTLESRPQGLFFWAELSTKLEYFQRSYMAGMQAMLTELYDCPPFYTRLLKDSRHTLNNPCIGILAASTKEWLRASVTEGEMKGGFLQRFMYVLAHSKEKHYSIQKQCDLHKQNQLVMMLKKAQNIDESVVDLTAILDAFDKWHFKHEEEAMSANNEEVLASFYTRLDTYCLKLCMLYEIAMQMTQNDFVFGDIKPSLEAFSYASNLIEYAKATINYMLSEELVFTRDMVNRQRVFNIIENNPGILRRDLVLQAHLLKKDLEPILETLLDEGSIAIQKEKTNRKDGIHFYPIREKIF